MKNGKDTPGPQSQSNFVLWHQMKYEFKDTCPGSGFIFQQNCIKHLDLITFESVEPQTKPGSYKIAKSRNKLTLLHLVLQTVSCDYYCLCVANEVKLSRG